MKFHELLKLKYSMDEAFKLIPNYATNGDMACDETVNYYNTVSKFLAAGRIYYNNNNISMDELQKLVNDELKTLNEYTKSEVAKVIAKFPEQDRKMFEKKYGANIEKNTEPVILDEFEPQLHTEEELNILRAERKSRSR